MEGAFGGDVDYAQLVKLYGPASDEKGQRRYSPAECVGVRRVSVVGNPDMDDLSTSYVERHNLTMRMSMRRFTRLTNAFSKKAQNHAYAVALYALHYNFCRPHKSLGGRTPAQAVGLEEYARNMRWIVGLVEERAPKQRRGPYRAEISKLRHYRFVSSLDPEEVSTIGSLQENDMIPRQFDGRLLATCRTAMGRDLDMAEKTLMRSK